MGRGDIKTKKGKISSGSFGVLRPHKKKQAVVVAGKAKTKKAGAKKSAAKKSEAD
jgi:30S ribosomal protein S31